MSRRRKFQIDQEADWNGQPVVIVGWRVLRSTQSQYRVVRVLRRNGRAYGGTVWVPSEQLTYSGDTLRPNIRRTVQANRRFGTNKERGCRCQCCVHIAVPRSAVNPDGTYEWEEA